MMKHAEVYDQAMRTRDITMSALFVALIAVCSWISIPASVPFTLQTFAVFLAVGVLGGRRGAVAVGAYLLLGAVGAPVFSGFGGGLSSLLGPTGGYLFGFLAAALVMWGLERFSGNSAARLVIIMALGLVALYAFGTAWFMAVYARANGPVTLAAALSLCVLPFVLPDAAKIVLAALVAKRLRAWRTGGGR